MPKEPNDEWSVATKDQSGNRKLVTKNIFMRYNVGDKVRVANSASNEFRNDPVYIIAVAPSRGEYLCDDGKYRVWLSEEHLASLTEGQDEQNELWEEAIEIIRDNLITGCPVKEIIPQLSFTIKRK